MVDPVNSNVDSTEKMPQPLGTDEEPEEIEYPSGPKVAVIMIALYLAMFLVALVRHPPRG